VRLLAQRLQPVFQPVLCLAHQPWQALLAEREHARHVLALSDDHQRQARRRFVQVRLQLVQALAVTFIGIAPKSCNPSFVSVPLHSTECRY